MMNKIDEDIKLYYDLMQLFEQMSIPIENQLQISNQITQIRNERTSRMRKYNFLYSKISNNKKCIYCGDKATTYDHIPPLYIMEMMMEESKEIHKGKLVESCKECNLRLSYNRETNLIARRNILHQIYKNQFEDRQRKYNGTKEEHNWK